MICSHGAWFFPAIQCQVDDPTLDRTIQEPYEKLPCNQTTESPESSGLLWGECFKNRSQLQDVRDAKRDPISVNLKTKALNESSWIQYGHNSRWVQEEQISQGLPLVETYKDGDLGVEKKITGDGYKVENKEESVIKSYGTLQENQDRMHDSYRIYDSYTLVTLLKTCANQKDLQRGSEIHTDVVNRGILEGNVFLGSALVNMYAKCGALEKAQDVFDMLATRNEVSWNALIGGYAHYGCGEEALSLFERMQRESLTPSAITFNCALKACGSIGALDKGQDIHAQVAKKQLLKENVLLANAVIDMYAKCGALDKAREVFDELQLRDIFSWTTLIAGYAHQGHVKEAFSLYDSMHEKGVSPNGVTLVCMLRACGNTGSLDKGQEVHGQAAKGNWLEKDIVVANAVVDMYAKCGALQRAREVFDNLAVHDAVSWTALIIGYSQHGQGGHALDCYKRMQLEGFCPNAITFSCLLKACGNMGSLDLGQHMHAHILRVGLLEKDIVVANALMDMYCKCGVLAKAQEVFTELRNRDVVSWTTLIVGYVEHELADEALKCFEQMQLDGFSPDAVTFACILKACGSIRAIRKGQDIHIVILQNKSLEGDTLVGNALIDMYSKCGLVGKAQEVFDELRNRDVVSWNALIAGYVQHDYYEEAGKCFELMQFEGFFADAFTFTCVLKVCGCIGAAEMGQKIHGNVVRYGLLEKDLIIGTGLIDMYSNCAMLAEAQDVFEKLPVKNVVSWSAFMEGYAQLGKDELVIDTFDKMIQDGGLPDSITLTIVLNTCSHRGLLDKGQRYLEFMSRVYNISPYAEHYSCIVDLFGRAGHFGEAASVIKEMPICANLRVLHTLLGACRTWGNTRLGSWAFDCAIQLDGEDGGSYVGMMNIHGAFSSQEDADEF